MTISMGLPRLLGAQVAASLSKPVTVITAAEIERHLGVFAHDSMRGHLHGTGDSLATTLARARLARYVAAQFEQLGLQPYPAATRDGVQRYPRPGQLRLDHARSYIQFIGAVQGRGRIVLDELSNDLYLMNDFKLDTAAYLLTEAGPPSLREGRLGSRRTVVLAGPQATAALDTLDLHDVVVLYVPPTALDPAARRAVLTHLAARSRGVLVVSDDDSLTFARHAERSRREPVGIVEHYLWDAAMPGANGRWAVAVRATGAERLLAAAGLDLASLRAAKRSVVQGLGEGFPTQAWLWGISEPISADSNIDSIKAQRFVPYVAALLEGTDSVLKGEYVILAANLGPGEDGTAVAGLLALARALSHPDARPRRSVLFVATSDASHALATSWFVAGSPPPNARVVAALTLERVRGTGAVRVNGSDEIALPISPAWLAATYPELGLTLADAGTVFEPGTVAYAFARNLVPSLAFVAGEEPSSAAETAAPLAGAAETEAVVRRLQFAFYLGEELATTPAVPLWRAAGRERYVTPAQPDP